LWNQVILAVFGIGLCVMIAWGYRLWWLRRSVNTDGVNPVITLMKTWKSAPFTLQCPIFLIALGLAISLPVMGVSLVIFMLIDFVRWARSERAVQTARTSD